MDPIHPLRRGKCHGPSPLRFNDHPNETNHTVYYGQGIFAEDIDDRAVVLR